MTCPQLLARLDGAAMRLAHYAAVRIPSDEGEAVRDWFLDPLKRYDPDAVPDALYALPIDPAEPTLLYDVRRDRFLTVVWTDWRDARLAESWDFSRFN